MLLEVALPTGIDDATLDEILAGVAQELGVDVSARAAGADVL